MTSTAAPWLNRLLTLDEWDAIDKKDLAGRAELVEGVLVVVPCPGDRHQRLGWRLCAALEDQLAPGYLLVPDFGLLVEGGPTPTVRRPDVAVVRAEAFGSGRAHYRPDDLLAAFEILSPGTRRIDRVLKLHEYAEAGIAHYGILEVGPPVVLTEFALDGGLYWRVAEHTGTTELALGATVDLDALR